MSEPVFSKSLEHSVTRAIRDELRDAERLLDGGKHDEGSARLEALVQKYPDYFAARTALARQRFLTGRFVEARSELEEALRLDPDNVRLLIRIGQIDKLLGQVESAHSRFLTAERLDPSNHEAIWELSQIELDNDDLEYAVSRLVAQPKGLPWGGALHTRLADAYERLGKTDEAVAIYEQLFCAPDTPVASRNNAAFRLCSFDSLVTESELLRYLNNIVSPELASHVAFARADLLIRRQEHRAAWDMVCVANGQKWGQVKASVLRQERSYELILEYCIGADISPEPTAREAPATVPILIVGPSRSGKSLAERLLAKIDGVRCGFESGVLSAGVARAARILRYPAVNDPWYLQSEDRSVLELETRKLLDGRGRGSRWLTLTSPANLFHVATVAKLFPAAPIIFVKRDFDDLVARIFATNYGAGHSYSYDLSSLKRYLSWSDQLGDIWARRLGDRCVVTSYESLVRNPQDFVDQIAKRLGTTPSDVSVKIRSDEGFGAPYRQWIL